MSRTRVMIRNAAFVLGGNVATWTASLAFWIVVPRIIGPSAWGEFSLGMALTGLAVSVGGFGISTFVLKEISRNRDRASDYVGASIATHVALATLMVASLFLFALVAGYNSETRTVILLVAAMGICNFVVAPAVSALQAMEEMHLNTVINVLRTLVANGAIVPIALVFRPNIVVLILAALTINVLAALVQVAVTHRFVAIKLRFGRQVSAWLVSGGLPFWGSGVFLAIYAWIDAVLLSLLVSTHEVGYYAAPTQVIATLGFAPALIVTVVFPALSSSYHTEFERMRRLTRVSLTVLIVLGLPITVGAMLVGPNAIRLVFGPAFLPSEPVMMILAWTVLPGYIATLAYWVLAAADRQRQWAYVMGGAAVFNPLINLFAIPSFQTRYGHGSLGAAVALLITDAVVCVAGLALMPRGLLRPIRPLVSVTARIALATFLMAIPVWFLRDRFPLVPVLTGAAVFAGAALALGVYRTEEFAEAAATLSAAIRSRIRRGSDRYVSNHPEAVEGVDTVLNASTPGKAG